MLTLLTIVKSVNMRIILYFITKRNPVFAVANYYGASMLNAMRFYIITLFPDAFRSYLGESIIKRAIEDKKIKVMFYNPKDFEQDKKRRIDDRPYGGGPGMVMRPEPVIKAIEKALKMSKSKAQISNKNSLRPKTYNLSPKILWFSPSGKQFDTAYAKATAKKYTDIIFICGRYEGIDARVKRVFKMEDISIGPFVLTGGELPAMIVMDCIARQVPGVLGNIGSLEESRVSSSEVYTRPEVMVYKGKKYKVPKVLLSGHRAKIEEWKKSKSSRS